MARIIGYFLNNTVLGPDRILNKALKTYGLLIALWLADIAKACFAIGYYLRLGRAIIIYILHKEGKADYLLLGSYRPIALENTLSKILERVVVNHITDIAEEHALLLQSQIGVRKNYLTLSVFTLLITTIKSTWVMRKDFIILILNLNISGTYNNIPYKHLLHILRAKGFPE
jgi:hypothetical protein